MEEAGSYKYDVAFSFLAQDEDLATEMNDLLQDRHTTFLYSKRQEEIAGTDGEKKFNDVFGRDARLVVVFYRDGWGKSPWTRIEETAIRNRAHEEGYDFAVFIPLDDPPAVPKWLPKAQIYIGLKRWGATGAAAVIEERVKTLGGVAREETIVERAARLDRARTLQENRERILASYEGVGTADQSVIALARLIQAEANAVSTETATKLDVKEAQNTIVVVGQRRALRVVWSRQYANSLSDAQLIASLWDGHPPLPGVMQFEKPNHLGSRTFEFDVAQNETTGWCARDGEKRFFSVGELAPALLKWLLNEEHAALQR